MKRTKSFTLLSGTIEGWFWRIDCRRFEDGTSAGNSNMFLYNSKERDKEKAKIRNRDKSWVKEHIPSSIWWFTEIHHDWKDGARMYLLTKGEHILRYRRGTPVK
ncbi:hypothetical protein KAW18_11030 [candidate division WOR-3 bacterium]|nr:hypothetical protein [candidate division WOR-3 bacterium]